MRRVSPAERLWAKSPGADVALSTWEESRLPACAPAAALEARPLLAPTVRTRDSRAAEEREAPSAGCARCTVPARR